MKRQLNVKFLAALLLGTAVFAGGLHLVHGFQVRRSATALLRMAGKAGEKGELDRKVQYLRLYLAHVPDDADALADYGLTLDKLALSEKARLQAFSTLELALTRDPERQTVRRRLVDLAMQLGRFSDARQHLEVLLRSARDDYQLVHLLGECHEAAGRFSQAAAAYRKANRHPEHPLPSYVRLAAVLRFRLNDPAGADKVMDDLVQQHSSTAAAWLARARYRRTLGTPAARKRLGQAEEDLARARVLVAAARPRAPHLEADVFLEAGELARLQGKLEQARDSLQQARKRCPREARIYLALAGVELQAGQPDAAATCLRQGVKALSGPGGQTAPGQSELLWTLAHLATDQGQLPEARKLRARLRSAGFASPRLDYLQARMDARGERWAKAAQTLEKTVPLLALWPEELQQAQLLLGKCYQEVGDSARQHATYRAAARLDPTSAAAHLGMGSALHALGKLDEAIEAYQKVPEGQVAAARLVLVKVLRRPPAQRSWEEVEGALGELSESPQRSVLEAEALLAKKQPRQAHDLLAAARDKHPRSVELWLALAALAEQQGERPGTLSVLDEAERQCGRKVELRLARVGHWARRGGPEAARALAKLTRDAEKSAGEERLRLLQGLAQAHDRTGSAADAERLYRLLAAERPNDLGSRLALFELKLKAGKTAGVVQVTDELRAIEGDEGVLWRYCTARRLLETVKPGQKGPLAEARALLKETAARRPGWARVPLCEALLHERAGEMDAALARYQQAIQLGEQRPAVIRRVVQLLYERRRYHDADQLVQKLQEQSPLLGDLDRLAAVLAFERHDYDRALTLVQKSRLADSRDYRDHLWLGHLYRAAKQQAEAEQSLRRAVALAPDSPEAWVALVQHFVWVGEKGKAEAAVREAEKKLPPAQAHLPLAHAYDTLGQKERARELYAAALKARPDDVAALRGSAVFALRTNRPPDAEAHLRRLLQKGKGDDAAWARRLLAVLLAVGRNYQQSREALAMLGLEDERTPGAAPGASAADRRAQAMVLAAQSNPARRRQAIGILEELGRAQPLQPDEQLLLAQLYESVGQWARAREQLLSLLANHGDEPKYLAHYASRLLSRGDVEGAHPWVARLEEMEPKTFRTLRLKALTLKGESRSAEAVPFLTALAREQAALALPVAGVLEELGEFGAAEPLYRQYAARSGEPRASLALALFLGRRQRAREALDVCEGARKTCPPAVLAQACLLVVSQARADRAQAERVERWLQAALEKEPKAAALQAALGALHIFQGRYDDAQACYRKALAAEARNVGALNNLAWLLALRGGDPAEALGLVQQAVEAAGPDASLLDTRALIQLARGRRDLALVDLRAAVAARPSPVLYFHLARACLPGDRKGAAEAWQQASRLGLSEGRLDPLERAAYRELRAELERK
jgi:tetratricopeptide (TPR) repeat protein